MWELVALVLSICVGVLMASHFKMLHKLDDLADAAEAALEEAADD